jgi:UDP-N-acetylmuramoyl-tripeptide--D-alanyl-D-alanine ligase
VTVIRVVRPLDALPAVAAAWRRRFDPLTVGITGSIAKTSTKEAVAAVLATRFRTLKNEGNENNEIGLPLTVLRLGRARGARPRDGHVRRGRDRRPGGSGDPGSAS